MKNPVVAILDTVDVFFAWLSSSLKQTAESYCQIQTADSKTVLVANDGSLLSLVRVNGVKGLVGQEEFTRMHEGFCGSLESTMAHPGHTIQFYFNYDPSHVDETIRHIYKPAEQTAEKLNLDLKDLFDERVRFLSRYCADEGVYMVLWTRPSLLSTEQFKQATKDKIKKIREEKIPPFLQSQNIVAAIPDLREAHDSFVRSTINDLQPFNISVDLLGVHEAVHEMRRSVDPDFTAKNWRPVLPGDKVSVKLARRFAGRVTDILWPPLAKQIFPRDGENLDLRTTRIGDRIYASVFIDLLPQEIKSFTSLFNRTLPTQIPWRISFLLDSDGVTSLRFKKLISSILSFTSSHNRLLANAVNLLKYLNVNTDDAIVKLRVSCSTWAHVDDVASLRTRVSELAKAIQGWGASDVSEVSGDPFGGVTSSMLGISAESVATTTVAPLSAITYMLPLTRPSSPWRQGALLFRSPDGKPWPFQPGSSQQTTYIDLIYARPGSGKSVLSNALNLALTLSGGLQRLPRIAIIDIGPSSSGLISLLREALPKEQKHLVAYHRLRMTQDYSVNPFDTQLGCRYPTAQERSFLVNFVSLLATPVGSSRPYDGITDMAGMIVDEMYKAMADDGNPRQYTPGIETLLDGILEEIGFVQDKQTTWWEVTDALFGAGFVHEALLAQRYAMPLLADAASICRTTTVDDLYGKIVAPTGEPLIAAFARMISSAVREYPILSRITSFDIGDARIVSLDLDEVAKSGGEAAERQTAVMYMLARYVLGRHFYLTEDNVGDMPENYREYHMTRVLEIRDDMKRIIYDEFHRTSNAQAVRDQVIVDMREGRKWKVQVALISQSLDDFDDVMVDFATSVFIMDAGPTQAIKKTTETFGLSPTAQTALRTRVHGPREGGATFLAQFATKNGINTQLLTLTLGPIELWSFSTTPVDAQLRNKLYARLGPAPARQLLARLFPAGSIAKIVEDRLQHVKEETGLIKEKADQSIVDQIIEEILDAYSKNPDIRSLPL
ncbi:MAG: virulence protein IcmB [marine bacterium B5-7]|nr:MAG: virulence protein IcmB [marine bacterium B5-7]